MKSIFLALIALIVTGALFAFTLPKGEHKPVTQEQWFEFIGSPGEENLASKYVLMDPQPTTPPCLESSVYTCAILIEPDENDQPDFQNNTASVTRYKQNP